jgi:hypothetical protein
MKPLLLADWRAINRRFCLSLWLIAVALTIVILLHFVESSRPCASKPVAPGTSVCVSAGKQARVLPLRPLLAASGSNSVGRP